MKKISIILLLLFPVICLAQKNNNVQLANEYYVQGDYEKAKKIYDDLAKDLSNIALIHNNYLALLIETKNFEEAEKYVKRLNRIFPNNFFYKLDLGILLYKSNQEAKAEKYFEDLTAAIKQDTYRTRIAADYLVSKKLAPVAIKMLIEARNEIKNHQAYALELANIYRILNKKDLMVQEYLTYVTQNPANLNYVKNTLQNLLVKPEELSSLESLLYDKIQDEPNSHIYSELIIWVNLQQKNFYGAFIQARALDKRLKTQGNRTMSIGLIALENNDYDNAIKILSYIVDEYKGTVNYQVARMHLIKAYEKKITNTFPVAEQDIRKLIHDYNSFIDEVGINNNTIEAFRNKALLHAFYLDEKDSAVAILKKIISMPNADRTIQAKSKLDLGDIYILLNQPWESTLLYAQVSKSHKNETLGYDAKLRNAKLSYYKGEFKLAQEHLDILKEATTKEIANDAMSLSILIKDNIAFDSTETAMKKYAAVELMLFQNKIEPALKAVREMRQQYVGHSLSDELLWLQADIEKKLGNFDEAINLLEEIVEQHQHDILSDDAFFLMASIYDRQLENKEKAMELYRNFLTQYAGSVFVAEARKRFRELRGDYESSEQQRINKKELY